MKFNPDSFNNQNTGTFIDIIKTFFDLGGFQMHFTAVARQTLIDAREDPELYCDLVVRVARYSAYSAEQTPRVPEHMIERTQHC